VWSGFSKATATLLDAGGLTVREIADQLGHRRISVTQDSYFGRQNGPAKAADVLGGLVGGAEKTTGKPRKGQSGGRSTGL